MESNRNTISQPLTYSAIEIITAWGKGTITPEQRAYYIAHYMEEAEKIIGKPLFEMNVEEERHYKTLSANSTRSTLDQEDGYNCPKCKNRGYFTRYGEHGEEYQRDCECMKVRRSIANMKNSGVYELLSLYTLDKYKGEEEWQKQVLRKARLYVMDMSNAWFVILGPSGTGKSHICTGIAGELLKSGLEIKYMSWLTESVAIKQNIKDADKYAARLEELKNVEVLYIDDFFKSDNATKPSPADIKLAMEVINHRYNRSRGRTPKRYLTIVSSERTLNQLMDYDAALTGRMLEMAKPDYLINLGADKKNYRLRGIL